MNLDDWGRTALAVAGKSPWPALAVWNGSRLVGHEIQQAPWSSEGVRVVPSDEAKGAAVIVVRYGEQPPGVDAITAANISPVAVLQEQEDATLHYRKQPVEASIDLATGGVKRVTTTGWNTQVLDRVELPLQIHLQPSAGSSNDVFHAQIELDDGTSVDQWFEVKGDEARTVHLDLKQTKQGISAILTGDGARPTSAPSDDEHQLHVWAVLDRTTVDDASWLNAFRASTLTRTTRPSEEDAQAFNHQIRRGMAAGFAHLPESTRISTWWFADTPSGMVHDGANMPAAAAPFAALEQDRKGPLSLQSMDAATYCTGIDLFDEIDGVLDEIHGLMVRRPNERHVVVVVGNSPPSPDVHGNGPFASLPARIHRRVHVRNKSGVWAGILEQFREERATLRLVYPEHTSVAGVPPNSQTDYLALQTHIAKAFEETGMTVVRTPATEAGVSRATKAAVDDAVAAANQPSRILIQVTQ